MARHRILLSVDDETHELLKQFSEVSGHSMCAFIRALLIQSRPYLMGLIMVYRSFNRYISGEPL